MKLIIKFIFVIAFFPFFILFWLFQPPWKSRKKDHSSDDLSYIDEFEIIDEILS